MPKINLLPPEFRSVKAINLSGLAAKVGALILAVVLVYLYSAFLASYLEQKKQLAHLERELAKYTPAIANLNGLMKTKQELNQLNAQLQEMEQNRIIWSQFLTEIKEKTPAGVAIGEISTGEGDSLVIRGETRDFAGGGLFYTNLKDSSHFKAFSVNFIKEEVIPERGPVIIYELTGSWRKGGPR